MLSRISRKLHRSGVRGVVASTLRHTADQLEKSNRHAASSYGHENEFIKWVRFAVPGMLRESNIDAMDHAIAGMPPGKPMMEIGSFCGLSTVVLSHLLARHSRSVPLFTCDKWEFEGQELGTPLADSRVVTHDRYQSYVKETFRRTMEAFNPDRLPHTIECVSDDFFRYWSEHRTMVDVFGRSVALGGEISFCYIDGNHSYDFSKRDFENTDRVLVSGGFILFDDSGDDSTWEVNRLVREIASGSAYELISRDPNYLFRKK